MQAKNKIHQFRKIFFHPRVFTFLVTGTLIIFLTFLTTSNALEIAISGIASVFIGIGVNNFTSIETANRDLQKQKHKDGQLQAMLELIHSKSKYIQAEAFNAGNTKISHEADEMEKIASISILLLNNYPKENT